MNSFEKRRYVSTVKNTLKEAQGIVVVRRSNLSVAEMTELRCVCRDLDVEFKVVKNKLANIAFKGTRFASLCPSFKGQTAIASSKDAIAPSKAIVVFSKKNDKIVPLAGVMGDEILTAKGVKSLGSLPDLQELRAQFIGLLQTPAARLVRLLALRGETLDGA